MGVRRGGQNGHLHPLEIGPKNQNFLENMKSAAQFRLFDLILAMTVSLPVRRAHCTRASSRSWCHAVVILQFTCVRSFAWSNLGADSSGVGLHCVTTTWFTSSCNSRRFAACCCLLWYSEVVTVDSGKPSSFILCEKKPD